MESVLFEGDKKENTSTLLDGGAFLIFSKALRNRRRKKMSQPVVAMTIATPAPTTITITTTITTTITILSCITIFLSVFLGSAKPPKVSFTLG